jgi:hypothetical protein
LNAQLTTKIVFWYDGTRGEVRMGLPEQFPAPDGFEKIVCSTAHEAEAWSERMRKWEAFKCQLEDEQREMIEGPIRDTLRRYMQHQMANARNNLNREFLRRHLEAYGNRPDKTKMRRESYLHAEAYEKGR